MATGKGRAVLGQVHALFRVGTYRDLTDGQLLERFSTERGEAGELAFAALVERHGAMVLRVCRSVLADHHDTEEAFQATFLVLVRKARALWVRESLGPWLHQVACRTASCARSNAARRRRHEQLAASSRPEGRDEWDEELLRVLHEEIDRLPERYRAPVVLCDLEGRTGEQAARHLGWPIGTVKSRLSRARRRLRDRLTRRGLAPGSGPVFPLSRGDRTGMPLAAALAESTARAASQFVTTRAMARGSAALLTRGVLRVMLITRCLKVASLLLVLGAAASGAVLLARGAPGDEPRPAGAAPEGRGGEVPVLEIRPDTLRVEVVERGSVEAAQNLDVYSKIEGQTTIISLAPEGKRVQRGELVGELDSSGLRDRLINQRIARERAEGDLQQARDEREAAAAELRAFEQVAVPLQEEAIEGRIAVAEAELAAGRRRVEKAEREADRDDLAKDEARLAVTRAEQALRQAKGELRLLREYTRDKERHRLRNLVARADSRILDLDAALQLETSREHKLETQIERCKLTAPGDGFVVYANSPVGAGPSVIEEGATIRERQKIFSIVDLSGPMRVNTKVHEAVVHWLDRGQRARIKVDMVPGRVLTGTVKTVASRPDPTNSFASPAKLYTTLVELDERLPGLRPGMTAQVEILVKELDRVLSVPVPAVLSREGKDRIAVRTPDGGFALREVTLGATNGKLVEVKQGLAAGESVVLDPASLLSKGEKPLVEPTRPAAKASDPRTTTRPDS